MKLNIFIILLFLSFTITAQQIKKFSIDCGGKSVSASGIQLIYTIGEVHVQELNSANAKISEGFITPVLFVSTAIIDTNKIKGLSIFPNPINTFLNIKASENISKITIYNQLGQLVKTVKINNTETTINFNKISSDTYLLKIEAGEKITIKQIIKK